MSYYYNYYIGYKSNGKIYPLGPYDSFGKLKTVVSKSTSFASDLHRGFYPVSYEEFSDELQKEFSYKTYKGLEIQRVKYLPINELPKNGFIKRGYFLMEDVQRYEESGDEFDLFYDYMSPPVYVALLEHEAKLGRLERYKNDFDEWVYPKSASDYMYYAYIDRYSKEFEAYLIWHMSEELWSSDLPKDAVMVALETEG